MAEIDETTPGDDLSRAWMAYAGGAAGPPRAIEPAVAEADFRAGLLRQGFAAVPWDRVAAPVEDLVWLLPGAERASALRDVALARAKLPAPAWQGEAAQRAARIGRELALASADARQRLSRALLDATSDVSGADARVSLLIGALPVIADESLTEAHARALDAAFQFPDEIHAGQMVAAVVLRAPEELLRGTLDRARTEWDGLDSRWSLLEELADKLPRELLAMLLEEAAQIDIEYSKAMVLVKLRARLPPDLLARAEEMCDAIEDKGLKGMFGARLKRTEELSVPPPGSRSAMDALASWTRVAHALPDPALAAAIAGAAVRFLTDTADLFAITSGPGT